MMSACWLDGATDQQIDLAWTLTRQFRDGDSDVRRQQHQFQTGMRARKNARDMSRHRLISCMHEWTEHTRASPDREPFVKWLAREDRNSYVVLRSELPGHVTDVTIQ